MVCCGVLWCCGTCVVVLCCGGVLWWCGDRGGVLWWCYIYIYIYNIHYGIWYMVSMCHHNFNHVLCALIKQGESFLN